MTHAYDKEITALLVIDPYNDFTRGRQVMGRVRRGSERLFLICCRS